MAQSGPTTCCLASGDSLGLPGPGNPSVCSAQRSEGQEDKSAVCGMPGGWDGLGVVQQEHPIQLLCWGAPAILGVFEMLQC